MQIIDNFEASYHKFLDARQGWDSYDDLIANENILMPNGFKAYCKAENKWYKLNTENEDDPSTYVWTEEANSDELMAVASSAMFNADEAKQYAAAALALAEEAKKGGGLVTEDITANVEVGGIKEGDVVEEGKNLTEVLKQILVKYFPPTITYIANKPLLHKKGATVEGIQLSVTYTKTVEDLNSYNLKLGADVLTSGTNKNGETLIYNYSNDITENTTFIASADDGKDGATESIKVEFVNPYYYGKVEDNTSISFSELTEDICKKSLSKKVNYTANNEYLVFAYNSSYGDLTSIKDKNNFENLPAFTKTVVLYNEAEYNVYVSADKITCSNFEYTFKI